MNRTIEANFFPEVVEPIEEKACILIIHNNRDAGRTLSATRTCRDGLQRNQTQTLGQSTGPFARYPAQTSSPARLGLQYLQTPATSFWTSTLCLSFSTVLHTLYSYSFWPILSADFFGNSAIWTANNERKTGKGLKNVIESPPVGVSFLCDYRFLFTQAPTRSSAFSMFSIELATLKRK